MPKASPLRASPGENRYRPDEGQRGLNGLPDAPEAAGTLHTRHIWGGKAAIEAVLRLPLIPLMVQAKNLRMRRSTRKTVLHLLLLDLFRLIQLTEANDYFNMIASLMATKKRFPLKLQKLQSH